MKRLIFLLSVLLLSAIVVGIGVVRLVFPEAPTAMRETEREDAAFKAMFDALDADEKDSYAHHAANLVSDENIACLKAILMDASEPQEVLETIYYDLLNRPEEVKTPILREVAEVENHPLREEVRESFRTGLLM